MGNRFKRDPIHPSTLVGVKGTRIRRAALAVVLAACTLAGAWIGLRVAGPATYSSQLGNVQLGLELSRPSRRGIELYVPLADWGLRAPVTGAPIRVAVEPRRIDRTGLVDTVTGGGSELPLLRHQLSDAVASAAVRAGLLLLAGGLAGGLIAMLAWHALGVRGRRLLIAPAGAVALVVVTGGAIGIWTTVTWNAQGLERPTYYASGSELERLLAQADQLRRASGQYADRVDVALRSIAGLLDDHSTGPNTDGNRRMMLASDIHNNVLTLPALRGYADGRPVILAGDFTINGSKLETGFLRGLDRLGRPVFAVSGNHDSPGLMRVLARRGVVVLTHRGVLDGDGRTHGSPIQQVSGLKIAGFEDPLQYTGSSFPAGVRAAMSFTDFPDGRKRFLQAVERRWQWWQALPERPDVLVVHQEGIALALANLIWNADPDGKPLTIVAGHTHVQRLDRLGPVTVVNGGTAGAGGIFGTGHDPVGLALLDFGRTGGLEASDLVQMDPTTSAARARRVITDRPDCDKQVVFCADKPQLPDLPHPGPITPPQGPRSPAER